MSMENRMKSMALKTFTTSMSQPWYRHPVFLLAPILGSVGFCRQCAVTQYNNGKDTRGRLVMSCMTPAADNTFISIEDKEAKRIFVHQSSNFDDQPST